MRTGKANTIVAGAITFIMLAVYLLTVAPTLSFWDCGEFITCSYIMGVPHPPGSPLLSLIGRVMSLIPFVDIRGVGSGEIAYRVNMIDVILGALTVMLTYLIMVRLIRKMRPFTSSFDEIIAMFASGVTAFLVGFSDEFWNNAVETETYMPSLFMQMLALWLALRWHDRKDDPKALRYLFLAAYIVGLGNGVHLTVILIVPTIFLIVLFSRPDWFSDGRLWASLITFGIAAAVLKLFTGLGVQYMVMAAFMFAAPPVIWKMYRSKTSFRGLDAWKLTLYGMVLCGSLYVIGFSVYPTVMVRAFKDPVVNEGDPDTWETYKSYIAREQYGQGNMYTGMFKRNAGDSWFNYQFGFMYARYLIQQLPVWGPTIPVAFHNDRSPDRAEPVDIEHTVYLSVLLLSLLLYGLYTHGREDWTVMSALLIFFAASGIGLVLYLNMENPQVRERSYFFLGSYYIVMYWIGMGVWGVITDLVEWLRERGSGRAVMPVAGLLFVLFGTMVPASVLSRHIDPDFTNWDVHDRTHDWAPWDYAYNILTSCEKDAVLFTNGDNDTFPLWYLQHVQGFRRDVRIVNLSLLNTDWYIKQIKSETAPPVDAEGIDGAVDSPKPLPIKYTDEYITNEVCGRSEDAMMRRIWPIEGKEVTRAGITWTLPNYHRIPVSQDETIGMIRIQDEMVANIIHWVNWTRPIYFAVTVAQENKINLLDYLSMEGMAYRLMPNKSMSGQMQMSMAVMDKNVHEEYQYRGLNDPDVYLPPNTAKLVTNYFLGFAQLCDRYARQGDVVNAKKAAWGAINNTPHDFDKRVLLYQSFLMHRLDDAVGEFLDYEKETEEYNENQSDRIMLMRLLGAYSTGEQVLPLVDAEISRPDFVDDPTGTVDDRLKMYALLALYGRKDDALPLIDRERARLFGDNPGLDDELMFGTMLYKNGLEGPSVDYLNALLEKYPDNPRVYNVLIPVLYGREEYEEALDAVGKLLTINPNDKQAQGFKKLIEQQIDMRDAAGTAPGTRP